MRIEIMFGVGKQQDGRAILPDVRERVTDEAVESICKAFGGCNVTDGRGAWRDPSGRIVREPSRTITIIGQWPASLYIHVANDIAEAIRVGLNQHTVMVVRSDCQVVDVTAEPAAA